MNALFRAGEQIPHGPEARLRRGDVLRVTGSRYRINSLERVVGHTVRISTDVVTLAGGLSFGALIGAVAIPVGNIRLTLGAAVGLLLTGIVLSARSPSEVARRDLKPSMPVLQDAAEFHLARRLPDREQRSRRSSSDMAYRSDTG